MEETNSKQFVLMKSRNFLLLVALLLLAGLLFGQTAPPASAPAAQNSPAKASAPPDGWTQAPAAGTPT